MKTNKDFADRVGAIVTKMLKPPSVGTLGGLASGSATEDRAIDRWREEIRAQLKSLRPSVETPTEGRILSALEIVCSTDGTLSD